jgi:hypothetical protein
MSKTKCPQGCDHPLGMRKVEEREPLDTPEVIETPSGPVVREERVKTYLECRRCGWVMDV